MEKLTIYELGHLFKSWAACRRYAAESDYDGAGNADTAADNIEKMLMDYVETFTPEQLREAMLEAIPASDKRHYYGTGDLILEAFPPVED